MARFHEVSKKIMLWDRFELLEIVDPNAILKELSENRIDPIRLVDN